MLQICCGCWVNGNRLVEVFGQEMHVRQTQKGVHTKSKTHDKLEFSAVCDSQPSLRLLRTGGLAAVEATGLMTAPGQQVNTQGLSLTRGSSDVSCCLCMVLSALKIFQDELCSFIAEAFHRDTGGLEMLL